MEQQSSSDKIGVGIIGAGGAAAAHAKAYLQMSPHVEIRAVADVAEDRARTFAGKHNILNWTTNDDELLRRDDVHVVSVCTPHYLHAPQATAALQAGKHVLVEKPMAISLQEADEMIAAAEQYNRQLGVIYQLRYEWDTRRALHLLQSDHLGKVFFAEVSCLWWRRPGYYVDWRGQWATEGGGAVINQASHHVDLLLHLMGMPTEVQAWMSTVAHDIEVEDWCQAHLNWGEEGHGSFCASTAAELESDISRMLILGTKGSLQMFPFRPHSRYDEVLAQIVKACSEVPEPTLNGHVAQIYDFVQSVRQNQSPKIDGKEGRKSLELITAIYQSAISGEQVRLPLEPSSPCYTTEGKLDATKAYMERQKRS